MTTEHYNSDFKRTVYGDIEPLQDDILVVQMEQGDEVTKAGIIVLDDNGKTHGVRPRWCQVYKVGKKQKDIVPGQWVLVEHGRWTRGIPFVDGDGKKLYLQKLAPKNNFECILLVSDNKPPSRFG